MSATHDLYDPAQAVRVYPMDMMDCFAVDLDSSTVHDVRALLDAFWMMDTPDEARYLGIDRRTLDELDEWIGLSHGIRIDASKTVTPETPGYELW